MLKYIYIEVYIVGCVSFLLFFVWEEIYGLAVIVPSGCA